MTPLIYIDAIQDKLTALIAEETTRITLGTATDWADYKDRTGYLRGLRKLEGIINELQEDKKVA